MSKSDRGAPTFTVVTDTATGKVIRIEAVLADGTERILYSLDDAQIADLERELAAPRH